MYNVDDIVDQVIKMYPKIYEKAKEDPAHIGMLRNECVKFSNRQLSPLVFSSAIARRIDQDLKKQEDAQNGN